MLTVRHGGVTWSGSSVRQECPRTSLRRRKAMKQNPERIKAEAQVILGRLRDMRVRATYGAVSEYLRLGTAGAVSKYLGTRRPTSSWVVSAADGKPARYTQEEMDSHLFENDRIVRTAEELRVLLGEWRRMRRRK